jgi:imidazolonepropionase-like amidohydrolase
MAAPSYIDAHVHLRAAAGLADLAGAGIAAVRDAGTREGTGLSLQAQGGGAVPRIVTAGRALVKQGGYGGMLGTPVSTREEIEREIAGLAAAGAGIIKIVASGVVSLAPEGGVTPGGFSREEIRAVVRIADRHGLPVMCHVNGGEPVRGAVEAGVRSIEHGFFLTEDALAAMAEQGTFWVPTIGALQRAAARADDAARRRVAEIIERHLAMLRKAFALGVPLAVGTDCVLPDRRYRGIYEDELRYFRAAGIPHDEVERIACEGGRRLLGSDQPRMNADAREERGSR